MSSSSYSNYCAVHVQQYIAILLAYKLWHLRQCWEMVNQETVAKFQLYHSDHILFCTVHTFQSVWSYHCNSWRYFKGTPWTRINKCIVWSMTEVWNAILLVSTSNLARSSIFSLIKQEHLLAIVWSSKMSSSVIKYMVMISNWQI